MKKYLLLLFIGVALFACEEEEEPASIVGSWRGDEAVVEVKYGLIPLYEDNRQVFDVTLVFNEDGTVVLTDNTDGTSSSGTYTLTGDNLTTDVDFQLYDLAGPVTFNVKRLTDQRLELELDREQEANVQGYGDITVDIIGHLYFDRN